MPAKIKLLGFVDADFAGEITTQKSQSGYLFLLCGGPIIWVSNRQAVYTVSQKNDTDVAHYNSTHITDLGNFWQQSMLSNGDLLCER